MSGPLSFDLRRIDSASPEAIARCGRAGELVVVGQVDRDNSEATCHGCLPEQLALQAERPVLIVPCERISASVGKHLLVAWEGTRESAMALRGLTPLLSRASSISLISPLRENRAPGAGTLPVPRTLAWLQRYGIRAEAIQHPRTMGLADALRSRPPQEDIDLVVMGGYERTRLREMVLGGVVQEILTRMKVPVLMAP